MKKTHFIFCLFLIVNYQLLAQDRTKGKIVKDFGETFEIKDPDVKTDTTAEFKMILDISKSSDDKSVVNKYIVTAARFLNMHANEGMKKEQLKVALTIHGGAWQDVMSNEAYKQKFGVDNPNFELINQLSEAGAEIILCGQTAEFRGLNRSNVNPNVKFALSAMTALLQYQTNGYHFIKF